jgi:hypothetical protein
MDPIIDFEAINQAREASKQPGSAMERAKRPELVRWQLIQYLDGAHSWLEGGTDEEKLARLPNHLVTLGRLMGECNVFERLQQAASPTFAMLLRLLQCGDVTTVTAEVNRTHQAGYLGDVLCYLTHSRHLRAKVQRLFAEEDKSNQFTVAPEAVLPAPAELQTVAQHKSPKRTKPKNKTIGQRMKEKIAKEPEALLWTIDKWMACLDVSRGGISGTDTWQADCKNARVKERTRRILESALK